jgi:hypothetical protein
MHNSAAQAHKAQFDLAMIRASLFSLLTKIFLIKPVAHRSGGNFQWLVMQTTEPVGTSFRQSTKQRKS